MHTTTEDEIKGTAEVVEFDDVTLLTVVKRNGMIVPFRQDRIASAIESAARATHGIASVSPLPQELFSVVRQVCDQVVSEAKKQAASGVSLTVEGIQDIVEEKLMESEQYDIARNYIVYREEQKHLREDSPRNLKILRRNGSEVKFNPMKIASAIEAAFRTSHKIEGQTPEELVKNVNVVTDRVVSQAVEIHKKGETVHVELIQDEIEKQLMAEGFYQVAKFFILYRAERAELREQPIEQQEEITEVEVEEKKEVQRGQVFSVLKEDGSTGSISEFEIKQRIEYACKDLEAVNAENIFNESIQNFYQGIKEEEIDHCNILAARTKVEQDPNYSYATARLLIDKIYRETFNTAALDSKLEKKHKEYFKEYLKKGIEYKRVDKRLLDFDLDRLADAIDLKRDNLFTYLGIQTLYDRYLIHHREKRIETPQIFWMRVAMGLTINEKEAKHERAIEFYDLLSQFYYVSSTPTLFNAGTNHPQLSSCYLSTVSDDLSHIFKVISDDAQLSKWAGGLGNDWSNVRATGALIKGTNGKSQGVIPFLKVANDTAVAVNQGGKRKGAMCAYLETWHLDIEDFLELRKNTGDERRRTHDMNTANWIPDLFMKRVAEKGEWTLFSPNDVEDLHDLYGKDFEKKYLEYEKMVEEGKIELFKKVEAINLWRRMLSMLFETGHPWITFKDPSNLRSPQDHAGVIHSSNLCTEILLNTSEQETAVCNLGSVNLVKHMSDQGLDEARIEKTVKTAIRMLDNVIDINFYPTEEARNSNLKHRPIGLGIMGFTDCLYKMKVGYASPAAVEFADQSMEMISYYAIKGSCGLAKEKGAYSSYKGSKWERGMLPLDTLELLIKDRGDFIDVDTSSKMDWESLKKDIKQYGMRNCNTMAIAPTATISNISGVTQSIEPTYKHLFTKSNLSGEFIVINTHLVEELKELNLWDAEMVDDLKYFDGSILEIGRIPDEMKKRYLTSFEVEPEWYIECASRRQKWIDMGQSLNLYIAEPSGKKLHDMYMLAWKKGLKTTYYLRGQAATQVEKSTTDVNKRGLQPRWMKNKSASSEIAVDRIPAAEHNIDGECESCQ